MNRSFNRYFILLTALIVIARSMDGEGGSYSAVHKLFTNLPIILNINEKYLPEGRK